MNDVFEILSMSNDRRNKKDRHRLQPQWKVDEMRRMYADNRVTSYIADCLDVSRDTVRYYCRDIEPKAREPLTNAERHDFMRGWR